jgi:hypothetical protein
MKTATLKILFRILIASVGTQAIVFAEEIGTQSRYDLLDKMIEISKAKDHGQQAEIWFKSLPREDFFRGLKQVNDKLVEHKRTAQETEGEYIEGYCYMAAGFAQYYFRRYPDSSPEPFLKMAQDHSTDEYYRKIILEILGDDDFYSLNQAYFDIFCNILLTIISDESNPIYLREEATKCLWGSTFRLYHEEKRNINDNLNDVEINEILKMSQSQFPLEFWKFLKKLRDVNNKLGEILLKTNDDGMTFHERRILIELLEESERDMYGMEPDLVQQITKRTIKLHEINSTLPIRTVQEFLKSLKDVPNSLNVIELFSDDFNYNGVMYSKQQLKETTFILQLINRFSYAKAEITVENLQAFSRSEYSRFFERRFSRQYRINSNDVIWMVHFEIHTYLQEFNKRFVDGVFIGLDQQDKIVAWFD